MLIMFDALNERFRQKKRTVKYPDAPAGLPDRFRGRPILDGRRTCPAHCRACLDICPTNALIRDTTDQMDGKLTIDLGRCLFCGACERVCANGLIRFGTDHRLAARSREDLIFSSGTLLRVQALDEAMRRIFGRSLRLRQVSAGGCNACEADANVLTTVVFDISRFGMEFVASPRHADGLYVTGPVTRNMAAALGKTYEALPAPKLVIAVGACAISGGPFNGLPQAGQGVAGHLPVDLFIPGCPPHPYTFLDGILRLLGRIEGEETEKEAKK